MNRSVKNPRSVYEAEARPSQRMLYLEMPGGGHTTAPGQEPGTVVFNVLHLFYARWWIIAVVVVLTAGLGAALTLVQTGKTRKMPIILVHEPFWRGLLDWMRERLVAEKMINPEDLDLIQVIDDPNAIVDTIFKHYEKRNFTPSQAERETFLNL